MDFMILGYPRSATTWMANLFTTDRSVCVHDPLETHTVPELHDLRVPGRTLGISCTGIWLDSALVKRYSCPKVVILRDIDVCNRELAAIGLPELSPILARRLLAVDAMRVPFEGLWDEDVMRQVWEHLLPTVSFDVIRYRLLREFSIQPRFEVLQANPEATRDFVRRVVGG